MFCQTFAVFLCGTLATFQSSVAGEDSWDNDVASGTSGKAHLGQFPWHAIIYKSFQRNENWTLLCSGVLIHPRIVLTGAVCASRVQPEELRIKLGQIEIDYYSNTSSSVTAYVKQIMVPDGYFGSHRNFAYDLALLELTESVLLSDNVKPAGVDKTNTTNQEDGRKLILPLWKIAVGNGSPVLHWVQVEAIPEKQCLTELGPGNAEYFTNDKACFNNANGTTIDKGNSGSGVVRTVGGQPYVVALVSIQLLQDVDNLKKNILLMTNTTSLDHQHWLQNELSRLIDPPKAN